MAFFKDTDIFEKWKYHVKEFIMVFPKGKNFEVPCERIKSISIIHNYETDWFPVFRIEVTMEPSVYYNMIKNKDKVKIKLRIQKYYTEIGSEEKSLYRDFINDTFDLILDDLDYDKDSAIKKEASNLDYTNIQEDDKNDMFKVDNLIELFLFKSSIINKSNKTVNDVLSNATPGDALAYIFKKSGMSKILMSPIENKDIYKELIIPPIKARDAIQFIGIYYGLFKKGYIAYIDFISGITYILNRNGKASAWKPKEKYETDILMPKRDSSYSGDVCGLSRKNAKTINYMIGDTNNISIRNESTSYNAYSALNSLSIDSYSGTTNNNVSTASSKGDASSKTLTDTTENKWFKNIYTMISDSKNTVIQISAGDYDASIITPNKKYKILFEESELAKKYKGNCILTQCVHRFIRDGADFVISSTFTFNLMK